MKLSQPTPQFLHDLQTIASNVLIVLNYIPTATVCVLSLGIFHLNSSNDLPTNLPNFNLPVYSPLSNQLHYSTQVIFEAPAALKIKSKSLHVVPKVLMTWVSFYPSNLFTQFPHSHSIGQPQGNSCSSGKHHTLSYL